MTVEQMINKIKIYQKKHKTLPIRNLNWISLANWEYELLTDLNAINHRGINPEYPISVIIKLDGDKVVNDLGGSLEEIQKAVGMFNMDNKSKEFARVEYVSRGFTLFKMAKQKMAEMEMHDDDMREDRERRSRVEKQKIELLQGSLIK